MKKFNSKQYSRKYYNRHLIQYREWEKSIGKNIFETLRPSSVLDLGCGVGSYLEGMLKAGCRDVLGIEISFDIAKEFFVDSIANHLRYGDITKKLDLNKTFDCVMSFETGEHIEPSGTNTFLENLTKFSDKHIIMTAAPPGQGGTGHVNLREKIFWRNKIESKGFHYQNELVESFVAEWEKIDSKIPKEKYSQGDYNMSGAGETETCVPDYILRNLMVFEK